MKMQIFIFKTDLFLNQIFYFFLIFIKISRKNCKRKVLKKILNHLFKINLIFDLRKILRIYN